MRGIFILHILLAIRDSASFKILAIFPYNGRSHHIYFSSIVEELASKGHDVTVINYFPVKKMKNLHQIPLQSGNQSSDIVNIEQHLQSTSDWFKEFYIAYDSAEAFKIIANSNCERLVKNETIQRLVRSGTKFDVVIVEQFVTDCHLALAHAIDAPTVGMTAHILMPWTYSRLGATNNPSFVPNHFFATGTKPDILNKIKSALVNFFLNTYYTHIIQSKDYDIVKSVYPETPNLELLASNISLILLNQYFPLTGSRLYGANVIEVGGMHIGQTDDLSDKELEIFLNSTKNGVVYISFGTVAKNFPRKILNEIIKFLEISELNFVWKVDDINLKVPKNTILRKWVAQPAVLCHPNVLAFVSHSGMLSSSEAMHCGVPIVSVPLFGDQYANAASAVENGLGVTIDIATLDEHVIRKALETVLQKKFQDRAKHLSLLWRNRPLPPKELAIFWIEYIAKHKGAVNLKPATVGLSLYEYLLLDVLFLILCAIVFVWYVILGAMKFSRKILGNDRKVKIS